MTHLAPRPDKEWLTAAEAAAEELPEFTYSERQLRNFLCDGTIRGRKRSGRGGGREFHWSSLPPEAREEFLKRHGVQQNAIHETKALPAARESEKDLIAEARKLVAHAARDFIAVRKLTIGKGLKDFSAAYKRPRTIALPDWVRQAVPAAAPHQVRAWWRALKSEDGIAALRDRRGRPEGTGLCLPKTSSVDFSVEMGIGSLAMGGNPGQGYLRPYQQRRHLPTLARPGNQIRSLSAHYRCRSASAV